MQKNQIKNFPLPIKIIIFSTSIIFCSAIGFLIYLSSQYCLDGMGCPVDDPSSIKPVKFTATIEQINENQLVLSDIDPFV